MSTTIQKMVLTATLSLLAFAGVQAQAPASGGKEATPTEKLTPPQHLSQKEDPTGEIYRVKKEAYKAQMEAQNQAVVRQERVAVDPSKTLISYEEYQNMPAAKREAVLNDSRFQVQTSPKP